MEDESPNGGEPSEDVESPNGDKASDYDRFPNNDEPSEDVKSAESDRKNIAVRVPGRRRVLTRTTRTSVQSLCHLLLRNIKTLSVSKKHHLKIMLLSLLAWKRKAPIKGYLLWNNLMLAYLENNQRSILSWTQETEKNSGNLLE